LILARRTASASSLDQLAIGFRSPSLVGVAVDLERWSESRLSWRRARRPLSRRCASFALLNPSRRLILPGSWRAITCLSSSWVGSVRRRVRRYLLRHDVRRLASRLAMYECRRRCRRSGTLGTMPRGLVTTMLPNTVVGRAKDAIDRRFSCDPRAPNRCSVAARLLPGGATSSTNRAAARMRARSRHELLRPIGGVLRLVDGLADLGSSLLRLRVMLTCSPSSVIAAAGGDLRPCARFQ